MKSERDLTLYTLHLVRLFLLFRLALGQRKEHRQEGLGCREREGVNGRAEESATARAFSGVWRTYGALEVSACVPNPHGLG